jgi:ADP-heptose:LPS heptosyltransferase
VKVLVARLDSDGDVLLAGPAIRAIAAGAERVTLLCGPRGQRAAELLPGVDDLIVHRAPWIDPEPRALDRAATLALVEEIGSRRFDEALILTSFHQSPLPLALLLRLAGVATVAATSEDYPGSLLDVRHQVGADLHEVERSLSLVATLGYALPPGDDGCLAVRQITSSLEQPLDGPYVVVHPGASVPAREWSPRRWVQLVAALTARGRRVAVTGSAPERPLTARVAARLPGATDLGGATTLAQLAEVIECAAAIVVGNTGPAHLAAAVGTPVVSLYAPTVPSVRWRPWRVPHELHNVTVACAGCRARMCPVPGHPCIDDVDVDTVLASIERLAPVRDAVAA